MSKYDLLMDFFRSGTLLDVPLEVCVPVKEFTLDDDYNILLSFYP